METRVSLIETLTWAKFVEEKDLFVSLATSWERVFLNLEETHDMWMLA